MPDAEPSSAAQVRVGQSKPRKRVSAQLREEIRRSTTELLLRASRAPRSSATANTTGSTKELVDLETQFPDLVTPDSPTQRVGRQTARRHSRKSSIGAPMLSLDNTYSEEEVSKFLRANPRGCCLNEKIPVVIEPKWMASRFRYIYENEQARVMPRRAEMGRSATTSPKTLERIRSVPRAAARRVRRKFSKLRGEVYMDKHGFRN